MKSEVITASSSYLSICQCGPGILKCQQWLLVSLSRLLLLFLDIILMFYGVWRLFLIFEADRTVQCEVVTWPDAVHHGNEGVAISPAGSEIIDLNPQLLGDLGLHPLEQGLLGADLPFLLGLPVGAALPHGPVAIGPAGISSPLHARTGETLPQLLQDPGVLLDLQIFI